MCRWWYFIPLNVHKSQFWPTDKSEQITLTLTHRVCHLRLRTLHTYTHWLTHSLWCLPHLRYTFYADMKIVMVQIIYSVCDECFRPVTYIMPMSDCHLPYNQWRTFSWLVFSMTRSMTLRLMCHKDLIRICTSAYPPSCDCLPEVIHFKYHCVHMFPHAFITFAV